MQIVHWKEDNLVNYSTFVIETQSIDYIMAKIIVQDTLITVLNFEEQDYISLTDMASAKEGDSRAADVIKNWIRSRYTIEFLGTWEVIHNPNLKWSNSTTLERAQGYRLLY